MSQVMKALQRSELSHQQYSGSSLSAPQPMTEVSHQGGFRWYHALWLTLPGLATAAVVGYQQFHQQQLAIAEQMAQPPQIKQIAAPFEQLDYPSFGPLIRADIEVPIFNELAEVTMTDPEPEPVVVPAVKTVRPAATAVVASQPSPISAEVDKQSERALSELDLSQLSPEMAARVTSILKANDDGEMPTAKNIIQAVQLTQHSDEFSGVLPAMNFQTHVYASNAVKRWIKVNGVEYREGDKIFDNVQLVAIKPQSTIVRFRNEQIEIPALYDWRG